MYFLNACIRTVQNSIDEIMIYFQQRLKYILDSDSDIFYGGIWRSSWRIFFAEI